MILKRWGFIAAIGVILPCLVMAQNTDTKTDTSSKSTVSKVNKPKPYNEVITSKAITDVGLFKVHKVEERYYFEIPDSLLDRDILTVNRISKAAAGERPANGFFGYAGDMIGENVIRFSKGPNNKVFIQKISYLDRANDSSENGMYRSVLNSNFQPIVASFDIKAYSPDSAGVVIDLTDYINGENDVLFFDGKVKKTFALGAIQPDKSYIEKVSSFPENIEVCTVKTFAAPEGNPKSYQLNSSIVLLPKVPMKPRYFDPRVGFFSTGYRNFDSNSQGVENTYMITRWRLEPKDGDIEKYKRGELVEPKKPIVFYIDPATPKKWVPFLIQGVNDWQKAFEQAGFKNAIYALEAPENDTTWSLEDARHNAIIYKPSVIANAYGPEVHDPRTGEILETHVQWFHNVMVLIHDWYMVQAGAIDPKARKMEFDDSLMGQLIRFVASHEVGHTLGLAHNFGASSTVPVDSLRSKHWVETNGHTPSIMDYARFNYVAQPEDSISESGIFPRIGAYDKWAIEWGYKWLPEFKSVDEERKYMNQWIIAKLDNNKQLWFGEQGSSFDPRKQSEDLGDDAMKAGTYGIRNLQRILPQLTVWTKEPNKDYSSLSRLRSQVIAQYYRYLMHVATNIGGILVTRTTPDQKGIPFQFVKKERQEASLVFLQQQLFIEPKWLMDKQIYTLTGGWGPPNTLLSIQKEVLGLILSRSVLDNLLRFEWQDPKGAFTVQALFSEMETMIWKEVKTKTYIDPYRRNLQKLYTERINALLNLNSNVVWHPLDWKAFFTPLIDYTDVNAIIKGHTKQLIEMINKALPFYKNGVVKQHLMDVRNRLQMALHPKGETSEESLEKADTNGIEMMHKNVFLGGLALPLMDCWDDRLPELKY